MTSTGSIEKLLDTRAAADLIGIHPQTILNKIRIGELAAVKIGRVYRIRPQALNAYLDRRTGR